MAEPSKLRQQTTEFTAAWRERKRLFEALDNLRLDDDQLTAAIQAYIAAAKHFDELRHKLIKP